MAIVVGTNAGFVTVRPSGDPAGNLIDTAGFATAGKFTSPAGTNTVNELGWYCGSTPATGSFRIGIYADVGGTTPGALLASDKAVVITNGWNYSALSYSLTAGMVYWIGIQIDTGETKNTEYADSANPDQAFISSQSALPSPWGTSSFTLSRTPAFYALYTSSGGPTPSPVASMLARFRNS